MAQGGLDGRVAIITGAAGGIGRALVAGFLRDGARVVAMDVNEVGLQALKSEHAAAHADRLMTHVADIADYGACTRAVAETRARFGGLHVLINNAAIGQFVIRSDHFLKPIGIREITPEMWQQFVGVNFTGAWNMTRASIDHLLAQRWGRIITVTTSFFTMLRESFHPYGPTKAGLEAMAAGHAGEFAGTGITVNVVVPGGPADTPMVTADSGFDRRDLIPPAVMAPPMLWLCTDEAAGVTGRRFVAAQWDVSRAPCDAADGCSAPIAWPDLARNPVWPGGRPSK